MNDSEKVSQFLVAQLGGQPFETFGVIFLDNRHRLIRFERLFSGSLTQTAVYPREVARRGLQLNDRRRNRGPQSSLGNRRAKPS